MRFASRVAQIVGLLAAEDQEAISGAILQIGRIPSARNIAHRDIITAMMRDKKTEAGKMALVLPVEVGAVVVRSDVPLSAVRHALKDTLV
jgi:3-dehydroquinate synthetase